MTQEHPITPPPELLQEWCQQGRNCGSELDALKDLATQAAQWGADQELEACAKWVQWWDDLTAACQLRAARRPKPPSLKEQALKAIGVPTKFGEARVIEHREHELIRRALEALDD